MDYELYHYGVKGMKWGVRRTPEQLGRAPAARKSSLGGKNTRKKQSRTKTPGRTFRKSTSISDDELQNRINRLTLEERYDQLVERKKIRENTGFKAWVKTQALTGAKRFGEKSIAWLVDTTFDKMTADNLSDYDIDDTSAASTARLKKATEWYEARYKYEEARKPKSSTKTTYADPDSLDDVSLQKLVTRLSQENLVREAFNKKYKADVEAGRGPVQDWLASHKDRTLDDMYRL